MLKKDETSLRKYNQNVFETLATVFCREVKIFQLADFWGPNCFLGVNKTKMSNLHWLPTRKLKLLVNLSYFALTYCKHCLQ